jgi:hypothetical protein
MPKTSRFVVLCFLAILPGSFCGGKKVVDTGMHADYASIDGLAKNALLGDNPVESLRALMPAIRERRSVDSVWILGGTLYVRYKNAGLVSWSAEPKSNQP